MCERLDNSLRGCSKRGGQRGSQRQVVWPRGLFHDDEINDLQDDELIEEETANGCHHKQTQLDERGGEIVQANYLAANNAGNSDRRKPAYREGRRYSYCQIYYTFSGGDGEYAFFWERYIFHIIFLIHKRS